jgi:pyrroloquinoline quinone (PQQ) biosynthesis protein C
LTRTLRRTAPFLSTRKNVGADFLLDGVAIAPGGAPGKEFIHKVAETLELATLGHVFPADAVIELVREQYEASLEFIYSHPIWEAFRAGNSRRALLGYLIETRHYLHSAASRMSPGVAACYRDSEITKLLARHLLEEADHAKYFEKALHLIGCAIPLVRLCRPSPVTLEWVYLMRAFGASDPLMAALCSGLMESSAADRDSVRGWHELLITEGLLSREAVRAIYDHVAMDISLGHGSNWEEAIRHESPITARRLRDSLNAVCAVSEMIVRWLDSIENGASGDTVEVLQTIGIENINEMDETSLDLVFDGLPVWPVPVLDELTYGFGPPGARQVVGAAFHLGEYLPPEEVSGEVGLHAFKLGRRLASSGQLTNGLEATVREWMRSIDGHRLWSELSERPTLSLVRGWLQENFFYLSSAPIHVSSAIAACPDPHVRAKLLEHLKEECDHGALLKSGIDAVPDSVPLKSCRPLATTAAFIGYLRELAALDWKAYCIALAYLQLSLNAGDPRHGAFYSTVARLCPESGTLLRSMRDHDLIDQELGHHADTVELLTLLQDRHSLDRETMGRAALVPQLAWSFLDGIRAHYSRGAVAISQRLGWMVCGDV